MLVGAAVIGLGVVTCAAAEYSARAVRKCQAEGGDRFLDEQRSYRAYPSLSDPRSYRRKGVALIMLGLAGCLLSLASGH